MANQSSSTPGDAQVVRHGQMTVIVINAGIRVSRLGLFILFSFYSVASCPAIPPSPDCSPEELQGSLLEGVCVATYDPGLIASVRDGLPVWVILHSPPIHPNPFLSIDSVTVLCPRVTAVRTFTGIHLPAPLCRHLLSSNYEGLSAR